MEFLDVKCNKRLESFAPCYSQSILPWRILTEIILFCGFKKPYKKIRETRKPKSIHEKHFVERKNEGRKPDKDSSLRRLEFKPTNLDKKCRSRIPSPDSLPLSHITIIVFSYFSAGRGAASVPDCVHNVYKITHVQGIV
jgi:hypothetical protein